MSTLLKILVPLINPIMAVVTPQLREELEDWCVAFYKKSKTTSNCADDILAAILLGIFDIPTPSK